MKTIALLAALLAAGCSLPAQQGEEAHGESHSVAEMALPELPAVVAEPAAEPEPEAVDRLRARWTLDEAFSTEEARIIVAAGDVWAAHTGRVALTFEVGPVVEGQAWSVRRGAIDPGTAGRTTLSAGGARMVLDADMLAGCEEKLLTVAVHEMGHALGIEGHGHTGGVMTSGTAPDCSFAVLPEDLEMFEAANPL